MTGITPYIIDIKNFVLADPFQSGFYTDENAKVRFAGKLNGKTVTYMNANDVKEATWRSGKWMLASVAFVVSAVVLGIFSTVIAVSAIGIALAMGGIAYSKADQKLKIWESLNTGQRYAVAAMRNSEQCYVPAFQLIEPKTKECVANIPLQNLEKSVESRKMSMHLNIYMLCERSYQAIYEDDVKNYIDPHLSEVESKDSLILRVDPTNIFT